MFKILVILKNADLNKTSSKNVRLTLESKFSRDFSDRRKEIDKMVMDYVNSIQNDKQSHQSSSEEKEKKKSPPKKAAKKRKANSGSNASNDDSGEDCKPEKPARRAKKAKKADREAGAKKDGTARKSKPHIFYHFFLTSGITKNNSSILCQCDRTIASQRCDGFLLILSKCILQ